MGDAHVPGSERAGRARRDALPFRRPTTIPVFGASCAAVRGVATTGDPEAIVCALRTRTRFR